MSRKTNAIAHTAHAAAPAPPYLYDTRKGLAPARRVLALRASALRAPATAIVAMAVASLGLLACGGDAGGEGGDTPNADAGTDVPIGSGPGFLCGNGELDGAEECDDGSANSDTAPDGCRIDCLLPRCGDGVVDAGEGCDDGNTASADGCSSMCTMESGSFEAEPNDVISDATPLAVGMPIQGFVDDGDVDCYAIDLETEGQWMRASLGVDMPCEGAMTLTVYNEAGDALETVATGDDGLCPTLDPADEADRLRVLTATRYYVCAEALLRRGERTYTLTVETGDGCDQDWEVPGSSDVDNDGQYDVCDDDDDGDGYLDEEDN
jgi:cysteine-rich repeat protein